jgi:hypothetical protein
MAGKRRMYETKRKIPHIFNRLYFFGFAKGDPFTDVLPEINQLSVLSDAIGLPSACSH